MRDIVLSLVSTCMRAASLLGILAILSRSLSLTVFSSFCMGLLIAQILCIFIDGGINNEVMRFGRLESSATSNARLSESTAVRLALGVFALAGFAAYSFLTDELIKSLMLQAGFVSGITSAICETYYTNLKAKNKYVEEVLTVGVQSALLVSSAALSNLNVWLAPVATALPRILLLGWSIMRAGHTLSLRHVWPKSIASYYFRLRYYLVDHIFSNINGQIDSLVIPKTLGIEIFSLYQPLSRLYTSAISLAGAIGAYAIPLASTQPQARSKQTTLLLIFSVSGLAVGAGYYFLAPIVIKILFNGLFITDSITVSLVAAIIFVRFVAAGSGSFLTLIGEQNFRALSSVSITMIGFSVAFVFGVTLHKLLLSILMLQVLIFVVYTAKGFFIVRAQVEGC